MALTFGASTWRKAEAAWAEGEYSAAWAPFRAAARDRGFIFPPTGTKWDGWEDDGPSQRAIVWRAIDETPELLRRCIARSRSWAAVVRELTRERDAWRERNAAADVDDEQGPTRGEAVERLGDIVRRLG